MDINDNIENDTIMEANIIVHSAGLKVFAVGKYIREVEIQSKMLHTVIDLCQYQKEKAYQFLEFIALVHELTLDEAKDISSIINRMVYDQSLPISLVALIHYAKQFSAGVVAIEATEKLNHLYFELIQNQEHTEIDQIRQDIQTILDVCTWFNRLMSKDWDVRDSVKS